MYYFFNCLGRETKQPEGVEQGEVQAESADAEETNERRERERVLEVGHWAEHKAQAPPVGASSLVREQRH